MRTVFLATLGCLACSGAGPTTPTVETTPTGTTTPIAVDAAVPPDADVPDRVTTAAAWIFRFHANGRDETWTLRWDGEDALLVVAAATGTQRYVGHATDGASLQISASAGANMITLDCKRNAQAIGSKCGDPKAKKLDVLDCYHPAFDAPMTFGPAPGVEYVTEGTCSGYRRIP